MISENHKANMLQNFEKSVIAKRGDMFLGFHFSNDNQTTTTFVSDASSYISMTGMSKGTLILVKLGFTWIQSP